MGKTGLIITGFAAAMLAACAAPDADGEVTAAEAENISGEDDAICQADDYAYLIGQSEAEAAAANLPEPYRIYGEGDPVTMDYAPNRLNVVIGEGDRVSEVTCG